MQNTDFSFNEIKLLHGHSSVTMLHICNRRLVLEDTSEELFLHFVLNIEVIV